jgi:hypothetical protein
MALPLPVMEGDKVRYTDPACAWGICKGVGRVVSVYSVAADDTPRALVLWRNAFPLLTFAAALERVQP